MRTPSSVIGMPAICSPPPASPACSERSPIPPSPSGVTLAWTDAWCNRRAAHKNNLDLTVTVGANTYKGNVFSGSASTTGGSADAVNNVECFPPRGTSGSFTVTVTVTNIVADGVPMSVGVLIRTSRS